MLARITLFSIIIFFAFSINMLGQHLDFNELPTRIMGTWLYDHSIVEGEIKQMSFDKFRRPYKLVYSACNDVKELKSMPLSVVHMRKTNILKNVKVQAFEDSCKVIDTYYPVARDVISRISLQFYGNRYKDDYLVELSDNKMVIDDSCELEIDGKKVWDIKHVYLRQ